MKTYYFTFGTDSANAGKIQPVQVSGAYSEQKAYMVARKLMLDKYGSKWAFQYPEDKGKMLAEAYHYTVLPALNEPVILDVGLSKVKEEV